MSSAGSGEASANSTAACTARLGRLARLPDLALAQHARLDAALGEALDRVLLAPLLDLLALAVDLRIGGGVAAVAVGDDLDQGRPLFLARLPQPLADRLAHGDHVHTVDPRPRESRSPRPSSRGRSAPSGARSTSPSRRGCSRPGRRPAASRAPPGSSSRRSCRCWRRRRRTCRRSPRLRPCTGRRGASPAAIGRLPPTIP